MEITLSNGKDHVYQWDKDIVVTVPENVPVVHFAWGNQAVGFEVENRQVTIPPELMQVSRPIRLWTYEEDHTIDDAEIKVYLKPKPADYAYTPTEIRTWEQLDERIKALEDGGIVSGVSSVNGKTGTVELTAEDVGAASSEYVTSAVNAAAETLQPKGDYITQDGLQSAVNAALKQAKESGEFDGDTGPQGPKGDTGDTGPQGPAGADGAPGKDGANGADGKSINWRGAYSATTQYSKLDAVSYEGSSYIFSSDTDAIGAIPGIDEQWQLMAEKGDKGDIGPQGPQGEPGADAVEDLSLGLTSATVGQTIKVKAVDDNGVPTEWEAVDMPSGGGSDSGSRTSWRVIADITLAEQTDRVDIATDTDGNTFELSEVYCKVSAQSYDETAGQITFLPNGLWNSTSPYITASNNSSKSTDNWKNQMVFHAESGSNIIVAYQLPTKGANNNTTTAFCTGMDTLTSISIVGKLNVGCQIILLGR